MVRVTVDEYETSKLFTQGMHEWLNDYSELVEEWLDDNVKNEQDWYDLHDKILNQTDENIAYFFYLYLSSKHRYRNIERIKFITEKIDSIDGFILLIVGIKRSGKTCIAYQIAEMMHRIYGREIWWYGAPANLPKFIAQQTLDYNKLPENVVVIMDEASVQFYNKMQMDSEQIEITRKLPIISHGGRRLIVITQTAEILNLDFIRQSNAMLYTSKFYLKMLKTRIILDSHLEYFMPKQTGEALYFDTNTLLQIDFGLPEWFSEEFSKPYRNFKNDLEAYRFILRVLEDTGNSKIVIDYLGMRSYAKFDETDIDYFKMLKDTMPQLAFASDSVLKEIIEAGMSDTPINQLIRGQKEYRRYNFAQTPVLEDKWRIKIAKNPELAIVVRRNYNYRMIEELKQRIKTHLIVSFWGDTGTKKSSAITSLQDIWYKLQQKTFMKEDVKRLCFWKIEKLKQGISTASEGDMLMLDEQISEFGIGSTRMMQEMHNIEETVRKARISICYASPRLRSHVHHFIFETYACDEQNGIIKLIVYTNENEPLGYITLQYVKKEIWEEYEKYKLEFLATVKSGQSSVPAAKEDAQKLIDSEMWQAAINMRERTVIARQLLGNRTNEEIEDAVAFAVYLLRQEKIKA